MSNILFIGNGFDISLGLKTKYSDFINSKIFEEIANNDLSKFLIQKNNQCNWVDIEVELKNYSIKLIEEAKLDDGGNYSFNDKLDKLNTIFKKEYRQLVSALDLYLTDIVNKSEIVPNNQISDFIEVIKYTSELDIINFNYTSTIEEVLEMFNVPSTKFPINNIHNKLGESINFGVEDLENEIDESQHFILKSDNDTYSQKIKIRKVLTESYRNYIFFGYSLGITDYNYFIDLFQYISDNDSGSKRIIIFYYSEDKNETIGQNSKDSINRNLKTMLKERMVDFKTNSDLILIGTNKIKDNITRLQQYLSN